MEPEALYVQLGRLMEEMPDFRYASAPDLHRWLGRAGALLAATGDGMAVATMKTYAPLAVSPQLSESERALRHITAALYEALANAELHAPVGVQGSFIPAGNVFDAMGAVGKVLAEATADALIVDPYMDETVLTDFAPLAPEGVAIRLLADQASHKATLAPAQKRWISQFGATRPVEVRVAAPRSLHDRAIFTDRQRAWTLTQSFNALAARSPASLVRVDDETAKLKIAAYEALWAAATVVP